MRRAECCQIENCEKSVHAKNLCKKHYYRVNYARPRKPIGKNAKFYTSLYISWKSRKRKADGFVKEWAEDFDVFLKGIGEQPQNSYLGKIRLNEPCGPNNFQWKFYFEALENETDKERRKRQRKEILFLNPNINRAVRYKYGFGITLKEYETKLWLQNDVCAICKQEETASYKSTGKIKNLAVDHCHITNQVRDLLCYRCNLVLGRVNEDIKLLEAIIGYLKKHGNNS